jgi:hypothetical protein
MTTAARRLDKVEASLSPTALVLRWVSEAHAYDDFTSYARSLLDTDPSAMPMDRLAHEAEANASAQTRGLARDEARTAIRSAIVATLFRYLLVLQVNVLAHEFLDREGLVQAALSAYLAMAISADKADARAPAISLAQIRNALFARVSELHALEAARAAAEARYLDGVPALSPAGQRDWSKQQTDSEREAVIAMRLAELDGAEPPPHEDPVAFEAQVAQLVADHVEPSRSKAYDELGDGHRALHVAVRWLRPKLLADDAPMSRG